MSLRITRIETDGMPVAVVSGSEFRIEDVQSAMDLMATVQYEADCDRFILAQSLLSERFFDLKTRLAGEVLQKFINYRVKAAIIGDFSGYPSKSLQDFIYECNSGRDIFFLPTRQEALDKLSRLN